MMKRTQGGMTLIGFIIVLALVGFFAYIAMKLVPIYS
jgi:type II secretory pathway pseudopilin PulG